jgi:hypothetical protein
LTKLWIILKLKHSFSIKLFGGNSLRAAALFLLASALSSSAAVVYDNGGPDGISGNEMTGWLQAEDFVLGASSHITGVRFWTVESGSPFAGSFEWSIRSDSGGSPGSVLATGLTTATRTAQGSGCCGLNRFQNDINVSLNLIAGTTYWLSLHNGPSASADYAGMYWETTAANGTLNGRENQSPYSGGWSSNGQEHAFALSGDGAVPEPGTWALLASGITVCLFRRRNA